MPGSLTPRLDGYDSYKNLIINGNMDLFQRGTSFTEVNNVILVTADRWKFQNTMATSVVVTQSTDVPTLAQSDFQSRYSLLATNTSANVTANAAVFQYSVEGQDYASIHGKSVRLSFWYKTSVTGVYSIGLQNGSQTRSYVANFTAAVANVWAKATLDIVLDTAGTWNFDNLLGMSIFINLKQDITSLQNANAGTWQTGNFYSSNSQVNWAATVGATFRLAQVSLIPGSFSSSAEIPFRRCGRNYQQELAMCQRYYEKSYSPENPPGTVSGNIGSDGPCASISGNAIPGSVYFKATKRTSPTIGFYNQGTGALGTWSNQAPAGGVSTGSMSLNNANPCSFMGYTASGTAVRMWGEWTADSEL